MASSASSEQEPTAKTPMASAAAGILGPPLAHLVAAAPSLAADADSASVRRAPGEETAFLHGDIEDNWTPTFSNPCLPLFMAQPNTPPHLLRDLLAAAWEHEPQTALKLVCHLRGVRDLGRGDKESFYTAAMWIHCHHPATLAMNVPVLAQFGYLKDFPELLYRLVRGEDVRKINRAKSIRKGPFPRLTGRKRKHAGIAEPAPSSSPAVPSGPVAHPETDGPKVEPAASSKGVDQEAPPTNIPSKKALKAANLAALGLFKYNTDADYRSLFDSVAEFFSQLLASDLKQLAAGKPNKIGLAAKWCPSLDSQCQHATLLCEAIARRLFPRDSSCYGDLSEEHYAFLVIRRLRREVLVPLRAALKLPETFMTQNRWSELPYDRVATVAMTCYKKLFIQHDPERFSKYLADVEAAKASKTVAAAFKATMKLDMLLPHKIIEGDLYHWRCQVHWRKLVNSIREQGLFTNCLVVYDASDDMGDTELRVCLSLAVLISEVSEDPWRGHVLTFSDTPESVAIAPESKLGDRIKKLKKLTVTKEAADQKTFNLRKVLQFVHRKAEISRLEPEKMVQTIFILTNKTFDETSSVRPWHKHYQIMCDKFAELNYGHVMPQCVYWNLQGPRLASLTSTRDGVLMLSGFSDKFSNLFMKNGGIVSQEDEMEDSITGVEFDKLEVVD